MSGSGFLSPCSLYSRRYLAWQLGGLPAESLALMRGIAWMLAICFVAVAFLSWKFFFIVPLIFSVLIMVCLIAAAWLSRKPSSAQ